MRFMTWSRFVRHLVEHHHVNREAAWRRANQVGDRDCVWMRSEAGRGLLMVQEGLGL